MTAHAREPLPPGGAGEIGGVTGAAADAAAARGRLLAFRDDGPLATALGHLARGRPSPLPGTLAALAVTAALLITGTGQQRGAALLVPLAAVALAGPGAGHPHGGRFDWLVPPGIRLIEYGYLAALGFAQGVAAPLVYVLLAVLAYHHYDIVYRTRQGLRPPERLFRAGLGWDGRMLLVAFAGLSGLLPFACAALAVYLGVLFAGESVATWARYGHGGGDGGARRDARGRGDVLTGDLEEE
ncbi:DUF5941 domain-containing protein [Actinomadura viridis]|uniref:DUF5941 domain-containing protein n=1 Tax=Actinomadura viridis TaxID=58110 RepID=UPI0036B0AC6A